MSLVELEDLRIAFGGAPVVDGVSLRVEKGECVAIVGESGAGKSLTARSLLGLSPGDVSVGRRVIGGVDTAGFRERDWRALRGTQVALVAQDALAALDPLRRVGAEVAEARAIHGLDHGAERIRDLLERVAMPDAALRARQYPHELSGGLRQRALIASALSADPAVLVADEATTALDATVQARVLTLIRQIADEGTGVVFVSHDFAAVRRVADRVVVMREGRLVEQGTLAEVLGAPRNEYTRMLVTASQHGTRVSDGRPTALVATIEGLSKSFGGRAAVHDAGFTLTEGGTLGIVGESGSGKTTLARMLVGVERPDSGRVRWERTQRVQFVHQNPLAALDPRWTVRRSIAEGLQAAGVPGSTRRTKVAELMAEVGLMPELAERRPRELSGGQRQRVAIARALAADPDVLVLDEPVSALDPTVRGTVLALLARLQRERDLTMVFVSHDLGVVGAICDDVLVMQNGVIVEQGPVASVFDAPQHPFTQELLAAS